MRVATALVDWLPSVKLPPSDVFIQLVARAPTLAGPVSGSATPDVLNGDVTAGNTWISKRTLPPVCSARRPEEPTTVTEQPPPPPQ